MNFLQYIIVTAVYYTLSRIYYTLSRIYYTLSRIYYTLSRIYYTLNRIYYTLSRIYCNGLRNTIIWDYSLSVWGILMASICGPMRRTGRLAY